MHIREVRSNRRLAKISAHNLAGRIERGSVRSGDDGAALRIDAALIKLHQFGAQAAVAGQQTSFGQSNGCVLTALLA